MMLKRILFILLSLALFMSAGCKTPEPSEQNAPRQINYSQYRSYSFADAIIVSSKNPAFSWPQFSERVRREIDFVLPGKGLEKKAGSADLNIYYYAIVETGRDYPLLPYQVGWAAEPFITNGDLLNKYANNTFVIDFVDTNTNQLVWRGSASLPFDDQGSLYKALPKQVHRLIQRYPLLPQS